MEPSQLLAVESFSDSWLSSSTPKATYVHDLTKLCSVSSPAISSQNFRFSNETHSFKFCVSQSSVVPADELFSNGIIRPGLVLVSENQSTFLAARQASASFSGKTSGVRIYFPGKWRRMLSERKIFRKLTGYFLPVYRKFVGGLGKNKIRSVGDGRNWNFSSSSGCSKGESWHVENSISEAILHCKKSIER